MTDFDGGTGRAGGQGSTSVTAPPSARPSGPQSAPSDLLHFVRGLSKAAAARALGLSCGTIHNLRHGYWPADPRFITRAWECYRERHGLTVSSSWFLRRVRPGGAVRHAGRDYTATGLAARTGQLLAVARDAEGGLLAQTLELPAQRLPLAAV